jgi:uncharacterized membrane protein SpoIIM required for sporulation
LDPDELRRLGTLYRSAAADLAVARRSYPDTAGTRRLQALVASAYGVVYSRAERDETPGEFLSHGLWRRIRQNIRCVGIAAAVMFGCTALGAVWALADPSSAIGILPAGFHVTGHPSHGGFYGISVPARAGLAVGIFTNNIEVAFLALAGGFTFGVLTVYSLAYNGALLGVLGAFEWRGGGFDEFVRLIVPHGLLELSCISLAGGAGLAIARHPRRCPRPSRPRHRGLHPRHHDLPGGGRAHRRLHHTVEPAHGPRRPARCRPGGHLLGHGDLPRERGRPRSHDRYSRARYSRARYSRARCLSIR